MNQIKCHACNWLTRIETQQVALDQPHTLAWQIQQTHVHAMYMAALEMSISADETKWSMQQVVQPEALTEASLQLPDHDSHQLKQQMEP